MTSAAVIVLHNFLLNTSLSCKEGDTLWKGSAQGCECIDCGCPQILAGTMLRLGCCSYGVPS